MEITVRVRLCGARRCRRRAASRRCRRVCGSWPAGWSAAACRRRRWRAPAYWEAPHDALADDAIEVQLLHAQQVKQLRGRKTDIADSRWLVRVCQFGLGQPSFVPTRVSAG